MDCANMEYPMNTQASFCTEDLSQLAITFSIIHFFLPGIHLTIIHPIMNKWAKEDIHGELTVFLFRVQFMHSLKSCAVLTSQSMSCSDRKWCLRALPVEWSRWRLVWNSGSEVTHRPWQQHTNKSFKVNTSGCVYAIFCFSLVSVDNICLVQWFSSSHLFVSPETYVLIWLKWT